MIKKTQKSNGKIHIAKFQPKYTEGVAILIRKTYKEFCSCDADKKFNEMSTSFYDYKKNKSELLNCLMSRDINFVLIDGDKVVGVAEGFRDSLNNFFIAKKLHGVGLGSLLLAVYEKEAKRLGTKVFRVYSNSNAVAFYEKSGYKKTTGVRNYGGEGILLQPMKKILE